MQNLYPIFDEKSKMWSKVHAQTNRLKTKIRKSWPKEIRFFFQDINCHAWIYDTSRYIDKVSVLKINII